MNASLAASGRVRVGGDQTITTEWQYLKYHLLVSIACLQLRAACVWAVTWLFPARVRLLRRAMQRQLLRSCGRHWVGFKDSLKPTQPTHPKDSLVC